MILVNNEKRSEFGKLKQKLQEDKAKLKSAKREKNPYKRSSIYGSQYFQWSVLHFAKISSIENSIYCTLDRIKELKGR